MKKLSWVPVVLLLAVFFLMAMGSGESESTVTNQGSGQAASAENTNTLGDYSVVIDSCRLAKDYEGKDVVIVKYIFTNNSDENAAAFFTTLEDNVYQNGVGLNEAYILSDSANYSSDNQTKEIKAGASIDVEVAYTLNDTVTDIEVEVSEIFSFDDSKLVKTFSIAG